MDKNASAHYFMLYLNEKPQLKLTEQLSKEKKLFLAQGKDLNYKTQTKALSVRKNHERYTVTNNHLVVRKNT